MKYQYWVTMRFSINAGSGFRDVAADVIQDKPLTPLNLAKVAEGFRKHFGIPAGATGVVTSIYKFEGAPEGALSAGDIEQLVADTENKIDSDQYEERSLLNDLLTRLRVLAGTPTGTPMRPAFTMTIGRIDQCLITMPHEAWVCGKAEAHR